MATHTKTGGAISSRAAGANSQYTNHYAYLVLTDGTTTITFQDGAGGDTNYPLHRQEWAPVIAGLRRSQVGGRTPYEDVVEQLTLAIRGTSAPDAYTKLAALARLLEQAERWARGENVSAVVVKFVPKGALLSSLANPLQATVLGRAGGDETAGVGLTGEWNAAATHFVIPSVRVRFVRRGLWLTNDESGGSPTATNGALVSVFLPAAADPSPTRLTVTNVGWGGGFLESPTPYPLGFLLVGEDQSGVAPIAVVEAAGGALSSFTSVADATPQASGNVLRYTASGTAEQTSASMSATLPSGTDLVTVFANVRHHLTVNFTLRLKLTSDLENQYTPLLAIPANADGIYPRWYFMGLVSKRGAISGLRLLAAGDVAGTDFFDIDTLVLADARTVQVLGITSPDDSTSVNATLTVHDKLLELPAPAVLVGSGPVPYGGEAVMMSEATKLHLLWLATGGGSGAGGNRWRQTTSADVLLANTWTISRRAGLVAPQ